MATMVMIIMMMKNKLGEGGGTMTTTTKKNALNIFSWPYKPDRRSIEKNSDKRKTEVEWRKVF